MALETRFNLVPGPSALSLPKSKEASNITQKMPSRKATGKRKAAGQTDVGGKKANREEPAAEETSVGGRVLTMGQGDVGQLGLGESTLERKKPAIVPGLDGKKFTQVTCGGMHTMILTTAGEVYTWGCNDEGALGRVTKDESEEFSAGKVELPDDLKVVMISAGDSHSAVLSDRGTVFAWGTYRDSSGQVGLQSDGLKSKPVVILSVQGDRVVKIASGNDHTAALMASGDLYTWGCAEQGQLGRVKECFATRGGRRGLKYILNPSKVRFRGKLPLKDVFCGSYATFAVARDNPGVYAWGLNNYGQLGTGDLENGYAPVRVESLTNLNSEEKKHLVIANGQHHTIALDSRGKVYSVGRPEYGRLGLGPGAREVSEPVQVTSLDSENIRMVACGEAVSFAISSTGDLYSWGLGSCYQLGTGDEDDLLLPRRVEGKNLKADQQEVLEVSAGGQHTVMLVKDRSL